MLRHVLARGQGLLHQSAGSVCQATSEARISCVAVSSLFIGADSSSTAKTGQGSGGALLAAGLGALLSISGVGWRVAHAEPQPQAGPGPGSASARPGSSVDPLTNHPLDYDPVTNEHTAKMTMARSTALEYYQAGKYAQAEAKFKEALEEAKLGFDAKDPHIASAKNNLAEFYRNTGRWKQAETLYKEALDHLLIAYGSEKHWLYVSAMHNLALMYEAAGDLSNAKSTMERVVALRLVMFGPRHFLYADSMFALGHIIRKLGGKGADAKALGLMRDAITILEDAETVQVSVVLFWQQQLGEVLSGLGRHAEAAAALRKALRHMASDKGDAQAQASQLSDQLVDALLAAGMPAAAVEVLREASAARASVFGRVTVSAQTELRLAQVGHAHGVMSSSEAHAHAQEAAAVASEALAAARQPASGLTGIMRSSAGVDRLPKRLRAAHVLASSLKFKAELLAPSPPTTTRSNTKSSNIRSSQDNSSGHSSQALAEAEQCLARAADVLHSSASAAEAVLRSGAPAAGGCSADELAGLVVEVQLQLLEVLESAAGLAARAGATERAEQWSARADALARQLL